MRTRQAKKILSRTMSSLKDWQNPPYSGKALKRMHKVLKRKKLNFFTASALTYEPAWSTIQKSNLKGLPHIQQLIQDIHK